MVSKQHREAPSVRASGPPLARRLSSDGFFEVSSLLLQLDTECPWKKGQFKKYSICRKGERRNWWELNQAKMETLTGMRQSVTSQTFQAKPRLLSTAAKGLHTQAGLPYRVSAFWDFSFGLLSRAQTSFGRTKCD
jgi:hypothetical protein